ncbi:hypothetical protein [Anabaena azotica]|uniref:Uncharacterized protein n=1 Tax=Anabaena azotica FACHB-119 TaxID=947527 RepID=A0ABR8D0Y5_9NOST|nr:hypothetical protein [Anabaena azotica]MBD2499851.1 hypothetical protein [Anabaena azotica FACHB-119]
MPYQIQQAIGNSPLAVNERYWGEAEIINFGAMTSCIAIIGQRPSVNRVTGIHLSIFSNDETPVFDPASNVLGQVNNIMRNAVNLRACLGRIDFWQGNQSQQVQNFFIQLMTELDILTWVQLVDGTLNVRFNNQKNTIQYQHKNGAWTDVPYVD